MRTLSLVDTFTVDGDTFAFHLEFRIVGATGDLEGSRGWVVFDGSMIGATGAGTYGGRWIRPAWTRG